MKKFTQLDLIQRSQIEVLLKEKSSLDEIARELGVSRQTIYREILRNSYPVNKDRFGVHTSCIHFKECVKRSPNHKGSFYCPNNCINYSPGKNQCLKKYPFVCNFCCKRGNCKKLQYYYEADHASLNYHENYSSTHNMLKTSNEQFNKINNLVSPLLQKGQSVEAIVMNHENEIDISNVTIRNWINKGLMQAKSSDLRLFGRRVKKQYNYKEKHQYKALSDIKYGHKYSDYLLFVKNHPNAIVVQLDTVIGCLNGNKTLLTIHIVPFKFQFGYLLDFHTSNEVYSKLHNLFDSLRKLEEDSAIACYSLLSSCLLTDNGPEFDSIVNLQVEFPELNVFYCRPYSSFEKGSCEKNHEFIRYIHYKGWSMDNLNQDKVNLIFSHINSYPRKSLNKKTPYYCVESTIGKEFLEIIGITFVNPDDVTLNPSLIKRIK